jgi:hypothetical protein
MATSRTFQTDRILASSFSTTLTRWTHSEMSFAIEVPGEAAPLTPQQVYHALQSAGSSQQLSIQTGTQQLQTWETRPGYYSLLQV